MNLLVGDFNVDFDRDGLRGLLLDFMSGQNLMACDLLFPNDVQFTYERGDGLSQSWIDHVLCSQTFPHLIDEIHTIHFIGPSPTLLLAQG